jgi:hypothetical protein
MSHDGDARQHEALELQRLPSPSASSVHSINSSEAGDDEYELVMADYAPIYSRTRDEGATKELNRRTVRKLDFILLPFLALLFLFNSLDRSNVSVYGSGDIDCS